jgi:uncharacterized protein YecT (DUF1311 family)
VAYRGILLVLGMAFGLGMSPALAEDTPCEGISTQAGLNQCAALEMEKADASLNKVYQLLLKELSPGETGQLRRAERAWIGYRDETCKFVALSRDGGSMQGMTVSFCKIQMINLQSRVLTWQLNCRKSGEDCAALEPN